MNCMTCEGGAMRLTRKNVPYRSLPGTVLVDVEVWECDECGEREVVIPAINELDSLLVHLLAEKDGRLTGPEVRFLRKHLGWSGVDFARHFGVAPETVSRWENGKSRMGAAAESLLRVCATRLDPIEDYEALEELLDWEREANQDDVLRRVQHRGATWSLAA